MPSYVGIDLGTTNSVVCSYDSGSTLPRVYKSREQNDVTPSAIYFDKRGKYYGAMAYRMAAFAPDHTATNFKRLMGSSTPITIAALGLTLRPEDCSAEILRVLFGYLPEETRNDPETGTVITVPAAFNEMQRDATLAAAQAADIGKTALMQEPVAAVMSVMRSRSSDGMFLVYDLGGGTLDIALAQSAGAHVSLLEHGGIAMCGGRDWDRAVAELVVTPWLLEHFDLPKDFGSDPRFAVLRRVAEWAAEQAKIELSARSTAVISLPPDGQLSVRDRSGHEIYLDVPIDRALLDELIAPRLEASVGAATDVLEKAHVGPQDVERIVFVGGPTQYKPLRDSVSRALGIPGSTEVNAMTAVAEGAAVFAESIDWAATTRTRKSARGTVSVGGGIALSFAYQSRTPALRASIAVRADGPILFGSTFQVDSLDSGWTSGRVELRNGATVTAPLSKTGDNRFKLFVFDPSGGPLRIKQDTIVIARTLATVDAIPASHSIGIAAKDKMGGQVRIDHLVMAGDPLPKKGERVFRAEESLRAGGPGALMFALWEGEIETPYTDNRPIGALKITGADFEEGAIAAGAELVCAYEVSDSGHISMSVTVPSIGGTFGEGHNFYSRQEGQLDFTQAIQQVLVESERLADRLDDLEEKVDDPRLTRVRSKVDEAATIADSSPDPESCKEALDCILDAKRLLSKVRKENLRAIRAVELEALVEFFGSSIRQYARPTETAQFENLRRAAERAIGQGSGDFELRLTDMRTLNWTILWRQDWYVVQTFKRFADQSFMFTDAAAFSSLLARGQRAVAGEQFDDLRDVVIHLYRIRLHVGGDDEAPPVNIVRG